MSAKCQRATGEIMRGPEALGKADRQGSDLAGGPVRYGCRNQPAISTQSARNQRAISMQSARNQHAISIQSAGNRHAISTQAACNRHTIISHPAVDVAAAVVAHVDEQ